jgi:hypothetical protein
MLAPFGDTNRTVRARRRLGIVGRGLASVIVAFAVDMSPEFSICSCQKLLCGPDALIILSGALINKAHHKAPGNPRRHSLEKMM